MDILIRNIEGSYIKILDDRSEKLGVSRNVYIKSIIEKEVMDNVLADERNKNAMELKRIADVLELMMARTKSLEENNINIITMLSLLTGVELEDLN